MVIAFVILAMGIAFVMVFVDRKAVPAEIAGNPKCNYQSNGYVTNDCSQEVAILYKNGLPQGSEVKVTAGPILERMSNAGLNKYRLYKITANVPLKNGLVWTAMKEADSEYMYIEEDPKMILSSLSGYGGLGSVNMESFQNIVQVLLKDYKGKGPLNISISAIGDIQMVIKTPEGDTFTSKLDRELKTGILRIVE